MLACRGSNPLGNDSGNEDAQDGNESTASTPHRHGAISSKPSKLFASSLLHQALLYWRPNNVAHSGRDYKLVFVTKPQLVSKPHTGLCMQIVTRAMLSYIQDLVHGAHRAWPTTVHLVTGAQNVTESLTVTLGLHLQPDLTPRLASVFRFRHDIKFVIW